MASPRLSLKQKIWIWLCPLFGHKLADDGWDIYCSRCGEVLSNKGGV